MEFRLICCAVICVCSALVGVELRRRLFARLRALIFLREIFRSVKTYISHFGMSLDDIADELDGREDLAGFCRILRENIRHNHFFPAFSDTLKMTQNTFCISDDDCRFFCSVASRVGSADIDGALAVLSAADEQLGHTIGSAREKCEKDGKLRLVLSLSCGVVAALLFL